MHVESTVDFRNFLIILYAEIQESKLIYKYQEHIIQQDNRE